MLRQAVIGLVIAASVTANDLAAYSDPVHAGRAVLFVVAGLLAAAVVLGIPKLKKNFTSVHRVFMA
jgi:hypothetical protein